MPTELNSSSASPEIRVVSNALENMTTPGIGPDQSDCRVTSIAYVSFDYNGTLAADPVVAVKATCLPLDGSNEGKEFEVEWTTGGKMSEFGIIDNGGKLSPTGARSSLANTSNWALLLGSLAEATYDSKQLDGPLGIRHLEGIEWTLRRVKQPDRSGLDSKNAKGRDKEYYRCLKISALPGEKGKAKKTPAPKPAAAAPAQAAAPAAASSPASNGASAGDKVLDYIIKVLAAKGNSVLISELPKLVFQTAKADQLPSTECMALGKAATADFIAEQLMGENGEMLGWKVDGDTLTAS